MCVIETVLIKTSPRCSLLRLTCAKQSASVANTTWHVIYAREALRFISGGVGPLLGQALTSTHLKSGLARSGSAAAYLHGLFLNWHTQAK